MTCDRFNYFYKNLFFWRWGFHFSYRLRFFSAIWTHFPFSGKFLGFSAKYDNFGLINGGRVNESMVYPLLKKAFFSVGPPFMIRFPTFFDGFFPWSLFLIYVCKFCRSIKNVSSFNRKLSQLMYWETLNFPKKWVILA